MFANQVVQPSTPVSANTESFVFAGDHVRLAGQMDYPAAPLPQGGYPLLFVLHRAGYDSREWYWPYAQVGLRSGYAVFRWDKRGTGRSGGGGRGSTTQDAVNAYEAALDQPRVNLRNVVILAQGAGTGLLGSSFGLFARAQKPRGVLLISNMLDVDSILAINSRIQIIMGDQDWNPWTQYARAACAAHKLAYRHGADYYVVPGADRSMIQKQGQEPTLPPEAEAVMHNWLKQLCPTSA